MLNPTHGPRETYADWAEKQNVRPDQDGGLTGTKPSKAPQAKAEPPKPKEPAFVPYQPLKTAKEAEQWAKNNLPHGHVDFAGLDRETANATNKALHELAWQFPDVADRIGYVGAEQGYKRLYPRVVLRHHRGGIAASFEGDSRHVPSLTITTRGGTKLRTTLRLAAEQQWWPANVDSIDGIIRHEVGHHAYWALRRDHPAIVERFRAQWIGTLNAAPVGQRTASIRAQLSGYAATNEREAFAEAFAEVTGRTPRELARSLMAEVLSVIRRRPL